MRRELAALLARYSHPVFTRVFAPGRGPGRSIRATSPYARPREKLSDFVAWVTASAGWPLGNRMNVYGHGWTTHRVAEHYPGPQADRPQTRGGTRGVTRAASREDL